MRTPFLPLVELRPQLRLFFLLSFFFLHFSSSFFHSCCPCVDPTLIPLIIMTPARRQRKRPASPQADQPKKKKAEHPLQSNSDNDNDIKVVKPKKESGKSKGKASSKSEAPADGEANGNFQQQKKAAGNDATAGSAQYAKIDRLIVPVDETCLFDGHVYVDGSTGIIYVRVLSPCLRASSNIETGCFFEPDSGFCQ